VNYSLFIYSGFSSGNINVVLIRTMDRNGSLTLTQSAFFSLLKKKLAKLQLLIYDNALGKRLSQTKKKRDGLGSLKANRYYLFLPFY